jgi:hypothetical protein
MNERLMRWLATILTVSACTSTVLKWWPHTDSVVTEDLNHDGRPDVWRVYDTNHHLTEVFRDTNLDGQLDVREYYEQGALVRRESDRDFNNQIDLVEDFDAVTGARSRSVIDLDYDGRADLLVLFQGKNAVFVKAAPRSTPTPTHRAAHPPARTDGGLLALEDPFSADVALRPAYSAIRIREFVGLSTAGGVPAAQRASFALPDDRSHRLRAWILAATSAELQLGSPRGPPLSHKTISSLSVSSRHVSAWPRCAVTIAVPRYPCLRVVVQFSEVGGSCEEHWQHPCQSDP